ncbi:EAL domain-containing protein [Caenimonas koreensis DSM 17982]|uniref:EAL domain-containing protein n=1 Tax=Caenimonas koreensis DSM 17982 TaxID=1121255 RepID=A0A844B5M5_9BURK|nr:EAL domain-containing protein [Caenimonas koreensis]MRD45841.1 EAL domain-containing protein [Caenimonas koreensis DSM 17982]
MSSKAGYNDAPESGSTPSNPPAYVFPQGSSKLDDDALLAVSPREMGETHRSAASLADSLIMMVDDEELNIEMTQAFLQEAGYVNFTSQSDSRRAIERLRERPPAVLLLDLSMPHVSGMDILDQMRGDKQLRHIPVIVLTSTIEPHVKLQALAAGAMDFLSKPVDPSELALRLRNTLAASAYRDFLAQHDPLTGLPNRVAYAKFAADVLQASLRARQSGALVHVGVDKLGPINDALGRSVGDLILQRLSKRLASSVSTEVGGELGTRLHQPSLFRFDGDEFAIVLPHVESQELVADFISKVLEDAAVAFSRGGQDVFATCSIGISMFPHDGSEATDLMSKASAAMRKAKEGGSNSYEFFSAKINEAAAQKLNVAAELRRAFARQQVDLRFEARLDANTGRIVAAEPVLYWLHPSGRAIYGDELLDLAGATDAGHMLAEWAVEQVLHTLEVWRKTGVEAVPVRVSLSLAQISAADVLELVRRSVKHGLDPKRFILEWQQLPALEDVRPRELQAMKDLAQMGFPMALGRFGHGQTSLAWLAQLPLSEVRLDATMLRDIDRDPKLAALLESTIGFVNSLGLVCVVSGVTSLQQLVVLRRAGATRYQGPVVDQPLKPSDFAFKRLVVKPRPTI